LRAAAPVAGRLSSLLPASWRKGVRLLAGLLSAAALALAVTVPARADFEPEFRELGLGVSAATLGTEGYEGFACGTNGGPPGLTLAGWADFAKCPAEPVTGLHEVYAEYGTRIGRISEMFREQFGEELWLQQYGGTRMANFPVVLSLLFDDEGIARGFRVVTDTRAAIEDRGRAYLLRQRVMPIYGDDGWDCLDRPPKPGETGVGDVFINQVCRKTLDGKYVRIETHFFRRPGQTGVDINGQFVPGEYDSLTRWEVFDASLPASSLPA
jgi:hypothetical protein